MPLLPVRSSVLMGNQSSNKGTDCMSIETLLLQLLLLKGKKEVATETSHAPQVYTVDPPPRVGP